MRKRETADETPTDTKQRQPTHQTGNCTTPTLTHTATETTENSSTPTLIHTDTEQTHTHVDTETVEKVRTAISWLEKKYDPIGTHVKYNHSVYLQMPTLEMLIEGERVRFLVDSGATCSVLTSSSLMIRPKLSGRTCKSVSSSEDLITEHYTTPLRSIDDRGLSFKHSFLLSDCCPLNLLGMDLLLDLGVCLMSTPTGIQMKRLSDFESLTGTFVKYSPDPLLYAYSTSGILYKQLSLPLTPCLHS